MPEKRNTESATVTSAPSIKFEDFVVSAVRAAHIALQQEAQVANLPINRRIWVGIWIDPAIGAEIQGGKFASPGEL